MMLDQVKNLTHHVRLFGIHKPVNEELKKLCPNSSIPWSS